MTNDDDNSFLSNKNIFLLIMKIVLVMKQYPLSMWTFLEFDNFGLKERFELAIKLTKELKFCHDKQIVHRDLKPTNIMVDVNVGLALVDFGIADKNGLDLEGSCGTPGFNAHEQFSGEKQKNYVDIFSLGKNLILILFEWKLGWHLLWSSGEWIEPKKLEQRSAPLSDLFKFIRSMLQVLFFCFHTFLFDFANKN